MSNLDLASDLEAAIEQPIECWDGAKVIIKTVIEALRSHPIAGTDIPGLASADMHRHLAELEDENSRLARTIDRKDEQMAELQEAVEKERQRTDAAERAVEKYKKETATAWTRIAELEAATKAHLDVIRGTMAAQGPSGLALAAALAAPASRIPAQTITSPASAGIRDVNPPTAAPTPMSTGATTTADVHGSTARDVRLDTYNKDKP